MRKRLRKSKKILIFGLECLLFVFIDFIYLLTYLIPKQKNKWLFGSSLGERFNGNSKYLFLYVHENIKDIDPTLQAIWITKNKKIVKLVRKKGLPCYHYLSIKGLWHIISAKKIIITNTNSDINGLLINKSVISINLQHGIPLKKINIDNKTGMRNSPIYQFIIKYILFPFNDKTDLIPVSSEYIQPRFMSSFNLPKEKTPILGSPRDDALIEANKNKKQQNRRILYAPTHRGENRTLLVIPSSKKFLSLNNFLKKNKLTLSIRLHQQDKIHLSKFESLEKYSQIGIDKYQDIEESMIKSDILITDFSSCYFDYLLLDKPIIFHCPDLKNYLEQDVTLYEKSYESATPGPKTESWDEVISNLQNFIDKKDKYKLERQDIKKTVFKYTDGKNCERVLQYIKSIGN